MRVTADLVKDDRARFRDLQKRQTKMPVRYYTNFTTVHVCTLFLLAFYISTSHWHEEYTAASCDCEVQSFTALVLYLSPACTGQQDDY